MLSDCDVCSMEDGGQIEDTGSIPDWCILEDEIEFHVYVTSIADVEYILECMKNVVSTEDD